MTTPIASQPNPDEVKPSEGSQFVEVMEKATDEIDHAAERLVTRKTDLILLPVLCTLLLVAFLDRTNIGSARVFGLDAELNMAGSDYNIALFIFFIPYLLLDVPANIIMKRVQPPYYFAFLLFSWGLVTMGQGLTKSFAGLVVCRFLLGVFEAGYFPGAIYLLAMYYTRYELHTRLTIYYSSAFLSSAFGGLIAFGIGHMNGIGGYQAWRWIFIIEGLFTVLVAVGVIFLMPNWPEKAKHLTAEERKVLLTKLSRDQKEYVEEKSSWAVIKDCTKDIKLYCSALIYFGCAVTSSAAAYFFPSILVDLGWTALKAQYMLIPISLVALVTTVMTGFLSDHFRHRFAFAVGPLFIVVIGYILLLLPHSQIAVSVRYMSLYFLMIGCFAATTISMTWMNNNIVGAKRRGISIGIMLGFGNCGSILGSNIFLTRQAPVYRIGFGVALGSTVLAQLAATAYFVHVWWENKQKAMGKRDHLLSLSTDEQNKLADKHPGYRYTC